MEKRLNIPFLDLSLYHRRLKSEIMAAIEQVIEREPGEPVEEIEILERQVSDYCGARYAVAVNFGVDALILALKALGIGPGDEVITSANSFISTLMSISRSGATPALVDIDETYNIDPCLIEAAITDRTRAIMPVHYAGRMARMDVIMEMAQKYSLPVIEDAAQAMGAEFRGKRAGSYGSLGCFSFFPSKDVAGCGDGGIITTNNEGLFNRLKFLRDSNKRAGNGMVDKERRTPLDAIQAAILLVKIKYLDNWNEEQIRIADFYHQVLQHSVNVPQGGKDEKQVYHLYIIRTRKIGNADLQERLFKLGVDTRIHHPLPMHLQDAYTSLGYKEGSFPVTEAYAREFLSLPIYPGLSRRKIEHVAANLNAIIKGI
jgi:dTDP-4-amino-4,6-dideoxygalactose transaminase